MMGAFPKHWTPQQRAAALLIGAEAERMQQERDKAEKAQSRHRISCVIDPGIYERLLAMHKASGQTLTHIVNQVLEFGLGTIDR